VVDRYKHYLPHAVAAWERSEPPLSGPRSVRVRTLYEEGVIVVHSDGPVRLPPELAGNLAVELLDQGDAIVAEVCLDHDSFLVEGTK
jgi:hypothetical protein